MKLYLDNIIYALQKAGGISVVWSEIVARLLKEQDIDIKFIESNIDNVFRSDLDIPSANIIMSKNGFPLAIDRYLDVKGLKGRGIFHSSYYRISNSKDLINVTTVHDFTYEYFRKGLASNIHSFQKNRAIKHSDGIICVSENTKEDLLHFNPKVDESKIKVIYNGVSSEFYNIAKSKSELLKELVPFETGSYVFYVGDRKSLYKNFGLTVSACKKVNLPLVVVGGGAFTKKELLLLNDSLGANNFIHTGSVSNQELNILYNNAFCLLYPSSYEGFGIPILEAQKSHCPVIATNLSSIPEVAAESALLVDKPDLNKICERLLELKNRSALRELIIKKGQINADRFSWDKCYEETLKFYKELYHQ